MDGGWGSGSKSHVYTSWMLHWLLKTSEQLDLFEPTGPTLPNMLRYPIWLNMFWHTRGQACTYVNSGEDEILDILDGGLSMKNRLRSNGIASSWEREWSERCCGRCVDGRRATRRARGWSNVHERGVLRGVWREREREREEREEGQFVWEGVCGC